MMRVLLPILLIGCVGAGRKAPERAAHPSAGDPSDHAEPGQTACEAATRSWPSLPDLDRTIEAKMAAGNLPGLAACIVKDGDIAWCGAYGTTSVSDGTPVTTDTPFLQASVSKLLTATAVGMLAHDGALALDDRVDQHLAYAIDHPGDPSQPIRTRAVLAHAGGIADNDPVMDTYVATDTDPTLSLAEVAERYFSTEGVDYSARDNFLGGGPERRNAYSNMGYALLGHQVEAATGRGFADYTRTAIFEPLGMTHTGWHLADFDRADLAEPTAWRGGDYAPRGHTTYADYPNGGLRSSAHDMACFLAMATRGGTLYGVEVLPSDVLVEMMAPAYPDLDPDQGLGWYYEDLGERDLWVGHSGGETGVATDLFLRQDGSLGLVLMANGDWGRELPILDIEDALIAATSGL